MHVYGSCGCNATVRLAILLTVGVNVSTFYTNQVVWRVLVAVEHFEEANPLERCEKKV